MVASLFRGVPRDRYHDVHNLFLRLRDEFGVEWTASEIDRARLREALRLAYVDGEPDGPRSYAALAWAVKGRAPQ